VRLQVLQKALAQWNVSVTSITHPDKARFAAAPGHAAGFICNLEAHWFTIRPVGALGWWNFNSLQTAPSPVGDAYLEAYLGTLREQNWTIYVVEGPLHTCRMSAGEAAGMQRGGRVWTPAEVSAGTRQPCSVTTHHRAVTAADARAKVAMAHHSLGINY
jgi:Josephin